MIIRRSGINSNIFSRLRDERIFEEWGGAQFSFRDWAEPYGLQEGILPKDLVLLWDNGVIRGWAILVLHYDTYRIWAYVQPEYRRLGWGRKLVERLQKPTFVIADHTHPVAHRFWEAVGVPAFPPHAVAA